MYKVKNGFQWSITVSVSSVGRLGLTDERTLILEIADELTTTSSTVG